MILHGALHEWISSNAGAARDHLLISTAILVVLLLVSMIPVLRPRTRYALVLLGVAKFLLPAGLLMDALSGLVDRPLPLADFSISTAVFGSVSGTDSEVLCMLAAAWIGGTIVMLLGMLATHQQWRRAARAAEPGQARETAAMREVARGSSLREIPLVARSAAPLPMTAGFLHPVVLLPGSSVDRLDDNELRAVLAHELAHVERRHNLGAVLQNVALALFWFHPALWAAGSRLHAEAEKDCDERVLTFVPDPPTYLSGMLKASYGFIAPLPAGVSCMSTSHLKERMDHLMKHHESPARSIPHRLALVLGVAAVAVTLVASGGGSASGYGASPVSVVTADQEGVTPPKLITKVNPAYPEAARKKRIEGIVIVESVIDASGRVVSASVRQGPEGEEGKALSDAAVAAVKQWSWEPAQKNGKAVAIKYNVTIRFVLDSKKE